MKVLVTGAAGFIGFHLCKKLLALGHEVVGLDNLNDYYDVRLKLGRLKELGISDVAEMKMRSSATYGDRFRFIKLNLEDKVGVPALFETEHFDAVCNLAAQAGVRYSLENPFAYVESNIVGFVNILEACRHHGVKKLVYASSSSVYGTNEKIPFSTEDNVDHPISLYAASKKANELMAHTYSHLFGIKTIGLRFFTVYGPWGRPDMALFLFTEAILKGGSIQIFNQGNMSRDFTYIDDIVQGVVATIVEEGKKNALYSVYNIGNSKPVKLMDFVAEIELNTGKLAKKNYLPMQKGDVEKTWADVTDFKHNYDYEPSTDVKEGIEKFINWYKDYYNITL